MSENALYDDRPPPAEAPPAPGRASRTDTLRRFMPRSWKDLLAIGIAVISLAISLNTSQKQATRDQRRQLTDTLDRYLQIQTQQINIYQEIQRNPNDVQLREFSRLVYNTFDMQNTALLAQAADLADQIPGEVTWVDYATMALGYASTGDIVTAEKFYRAAIDAADDSGGGSGANPYAVGRARNMYAAFLFTQPSRIEDGRREYRAINALMRSMDVEDELKLSYEVNNDLYWARSELSIADLGGADKVLAEACEVAKTSTLARNRDALIAGINETWALVHQAAFTRAGAAPFCE